MKIKEKDANVMLKGIRSGECFRLGSTIAIKTDETIGMAG